MKFNLKSYNAIDRTALLQDPISGKEVIIQKIPDLDEIEVINWIVDRATGLFKEIQPNKITLDKYIGKSIKKIKPKKVKK